MFHIYFRKRVKFYRLIWKNDYLKILLTVRILNGTFYPQPLVLVSLPPSKKNCKRRQRFISANTVRIRSRAETIATASIVRRKQQAGHKSIVKVHKKTLMSSKTQMTHDKSADNMSKPRNVLYKKLTKSTHTSLNMRLVSSRQKSRIARRLVVVFQSRQAEPSDLWSLQRFMAIKSRGRVDMFTQAKNVSEKQVPPALTAY